ncbi:MAG: alpha/beta fold hydrolase [Phycisphaerales bacterium]
MIGSIVYGDGLRPKLDGIRLQRVRGPHGWMRLLSAGDADGQHALLIHGTPGNASGWSRILASAPVGMHLAAIDRPGFGDSEPKHAVPSLREQASALLPVLERSRAPVILVGHSLGAPIACTAAVMWPELIAGLLLVSGAMDPGLERLRWYNRACRAAGPLVGRSLRNSNHEIWDLRSELEALRPLLPEIRCTVSLLHGTQDRLAPIANVDYTIPLLTGSESIRRVDLPGVGHFVPWQRQVALTQEFLSLAQHCRSDSVPGRYESASVDPPSVTQSLPHFGVPAEP